MVEIAVRIILLALFLIAMPSGGYFEAEPPVKTAVVEIAAGRRDTFIEALRAFSDREKFVVTINKEMPDFVFMAKAGTTIIAAQSFPPHSYRLAAYRSAGGDADAPVRALDSLLKSLEEADGITIVPER